MTKPVSPKYSTGLRRTTIKKTRQDSYEYESNSVSPAIAKIDNDVIRIAKEMVQEKITLLRASYSYRREVVSLF